MARGMILNPVDDVAVALEPVAVGDVVRLPDGREIVALNPIPFAHKLALRPLQEGDRVHKYGEVIGAATKAIAVGEHVHVHNIKSLRV